MQEITNTVNLHQGHRKRLRERFIESGGRDLTDHELLELLLFFVIPRLNTNETAHQLIREFGSLRGVCNADRERLERVTGVGSSVSLFFLLLFVIRKRIDMEKYTKKRFEADALSKVGNFFIDYFKGVMREELCVMLLDSSYKMIDCSSFSTGGTSSTGVDITAIARYALQNDARHVIIAHNHPAGSNAPSDNDRQINIDLEKALNAVGICFMEHIIVNELSYSPTMQMRLSSANANEMTKQYRYFYNN